MLTAIVCWSCEPRRHAQWLRCCARWLVVVPDVACFQLTRLLLNGTLFLYPPPCDLLLVHEARGPLGDEAVIWEPDPTVAADIRLLESMEVAASGACGASGQPVAEAAVDASRSRAFGPGDLPDSVDCGFAQVEQGFDGGRGLGFLRVLGRDAGQTEEGLLRMMDFMDAFIASPNAAEGFAVTYDLRALRTPSIALLTAVAEWGNKPERQRTWQTLNMACKVVVSSGVRYSLCKGTLTAFFFMCPPVCRTYLLMDPDEPEEKACIFEPPPKEGADRAGAGGSGALAGSGGALAGGGPQASESTASSEIPFCQTPVGLST